MHPFHPGKTTDQLIRRVEGHSISAILQVYVTVKSGAVRSAYRLHQGLNALGGCRRCL